MATGATEGAEFEVVPVALSPVEVEWLDLVRGRVSREDFLVGLLMARSHLEFRVTSG